MPYDAKAVANFFIDLATAMKIPVSPMKLQKLVYFAHGWNLAVRDEPLIDELIQAWVFGPVIQSLYRECKGYGSEPITQKLSEFEMRPDHGFRWFTPEVENDEPTKALLTRVWDIYSKYSAIQLSNMTHDRSGPWYKVLEAKGVNPESSANFPKGVTIPDVMIKEYFRGLANPQR